MSALGSLTDEQLAELEEVRAYRHIRALISAEPLTHLLRALLTNTIFAASVPAGTEPSVTVGDGGVVEVVAMTAKITDSATVSNRTPGFRILDADSNLIMRLPGSFTETANSSDTWSWAVGFGDHIAAGGIAQSLPTPAPIVKTGWSFGINTSGFQVGDQWTNIMFTTVKYTPAAIANACRILLEDMESTGQW